MFKKNKDIFLGLIIFAIVASFVVGIVVNDKTALLERVKQQLAVETDEGAQIAIKNGKTNKDWVINAIEHGKLSIQGMQLYLDAGIIDASDVYKALKSTRNKSVINKVEINGVSYRVYVPAANEIKLANIKKDLQAGKTASAYGFTKTEAKLLAKKTKNIDTYSGDKEVASVAYQVLMENSLFKTQKEVDKLVAYVKANYPQIEEVDRTVQYAKKYVREVGVDSRLATIVASSPKGFLFASPALVLLGIFILLGGFKKEK
jgi:hypothetical protein